MQNFFSTKELVPPKVYELLGEISRKLMNPKIVDMQNLLRAWAGSPMFVNSPAMNRTESGLRTPDCKNYSPTSQHSDGNAIDSVCLKKTPKEFHLHILENLDKYPHITFIEIDVTWLHIDCRVNSDGARIKLWSPKRGFVSVSDYIKELKGEL